MVCVNRFCMKIQKLFTFTVSPTLLIYVFKTVQLFANPLMRHLHLLLKLLHLFVLLQNAWQSSNFYKKILEWIIQWVSNLCPTRWTIRTATIKSFLSNYSVISAEFERVSQGNYVEAARKACGLLAMMDKFCLLWFKACTYYICSNWRSVKSSTVDRGGGGSRYKLPGPHINRQQQGPPCLVSKILV